MTVSLKGFASAIIYNISVIAGLNDPQLKISPVGFLRMLLENNALTQVLNAEELQQGQARDIKVRYQQRGLESEVSDRDDCDTNITPEWKESNIGAPLFNKIGIFISDDQMRKYELAATNPTALGKDAVNVSRSMYETILTHIGALLGKIDSNLVAAQATKWGTNAAYGTADAQNIALGTKADMEDGLVKLQLDAETNEVYGDLLICGNGRVRAFDLYNKLKNGFDASGFGALSLNAYSDPKTVAGWGKDHFGVFAKGTVGFVDVNKNVGVYAGEKGDSVFFQIPMPAMVNGVVVPISFDCQLKYETCPQYNAEGVKIADRGYKLIISKTYGLFNQPSDAYKDGDPLAGVNGSFHYVATAQE